MELLLAQNALLINGAGATFPYPIYSKWFDEYHKANGSQINYQSVGSGAGIKQVTEGTVDFGASDGPMNDDQIKAYQDKNGSGNSALSDRAGRSGSDLQHSRCQRGAEFYSRSAVGNFPGHEFQSGTIRQSPAPTKA